MEKPRRMWAAFVCLFVGMPLCAQEDAKVPWSFRPLSRAEPPRTKFDRLSDNPIDHFLFARLADKGLTPAPPATRLSLLRRVTVDLTGLLPTPAEVDAFLADTAPDAYEKLVNRLLASPAYGERWGRHWLDVVRFGESHGYEQNHIRPNAWPYRDYVIRAFNDDKPFSQFIEEQLAGDVLGKGDVNVEAATGFLVAGVHDTVGNSTLEGQLQQRANDLEDIVSTVGAAFLGLTVGCAKCHDHKFDPIPQRDFYRLAAVFAGVRHAERPLTPAVPRKDDDEIARKIRSLQGQLSDLDGLARAAILKAQGLKVPRPAVNTRRNVEEFAPKLARFVRFTITATKADSQPCLDEIDIYGPDGGDNLALASAGARATASSLLPGYPIHQVHHLNDGKYGNEWSWISNERGRGWAMIELAKPAQVSRLIWGRDASEPARYFDRLPIVYDVEVSQDGANWQSVATGADRAAASEAIPLDALTKALSAEQRRVRKQLAGQLDELRAKLVGQAAKTAYIGQFSAPDTVHLLRRGDVLQNREVVEPGALSTILKESAFNIEGKLGEGGRRLALANWLTHPENPLTARVIVNRVWQHHFGRGLVATPSDFGNNGSTPSHPELLDWLARDFQEHGWRLKRLHKQVVLSYAYQQTSAMNEHGHAADADNTLLWRMPLRRLEAEALRDTILQVSGKLDRTMGGPSYRLFKYNVVNVAIYEPLTEYGPETWRRSVYALSARAIRDDLMGSFDVPECSQRNPRREVTTTPLQALSLLNGAFAVQQAKFFAERVRREAGEGIDEQVVHAFRVAFGRNPAAEELQAGAALVTSHGLAALCRALISANEFAYY